MNVGSKPLCEADACLQVNMLYRTKFDLNVAKSIQTLHFETYVIRYNRESVYRRIKSCQIKTTLSKILFNNLIERRHDKTNKMRVHPIWSESSLSAWRKLGSLATHWAHAQADLSLRWAHTHFVRFIMSRLSCFVEQTGTSLQVQPTCLWNSFTGMKCFSF